MRSSSSWMTKLRWYRAANLETRAFEVTGENGVVVHDAKEVGRLSRFFARLWHEGCEREMPPGESYTVQRRAAEKSPCTVEMPAVDSPCGLIWTHHNEQFILRAIHDTIGRAQKRLVLSTFSLCGMREHPELLFAPPAGNDRSRFGREHFDPKPEQHIWSSPRLCRN